MINFNLEVIVLKPLENSYNTRNQSLDLKTVHFGERNVKIGPKLPKILHILMLIFFAFFAPLFFAKKAKNANKFFAKKIAKNGKSRHECKIHHANFVHAFSCECYKGFLTN